MKNAKWMLPVMLFLLSGLMTAQSLNKTVVAQVPFDFMVGNKVIPAGECVIQVADQNILTIRNFDAHQSALSASSRADENRAEGTALMFRQYGGQYFLAGVRIEGSDRTYKLPQTRAESELRAHKAPASQTTLLAVLK